jgi:prepilin-type N-terminal cleavage/methylation domain-containing protein
VHRRRGAAGFSLVEVLAVVAILALTVGTAALYLQPTPAPVDSGAVLLEQFFGLARARAVATTSAYRLTPASSSRITAEVADNCSASTWTADPQVELELPQSVTMTSTAWAVCFTSRGAADSSVVVTLTHPGFGNEQVEVVMGGSARIVP